MAIAIALFIGGLGTQFDIQDKIVVNEQYKEGIIIHIAKYLAPTFNVAADMMNDINAMINGMTTWKYLSPVLSACLAHKNVATTAIQYGGAVRHKVVMLSKFNVPTTVGKKLVTPTGCNQE